ncbi:TraR/DksA C4-type zinc finger protein [Candidatus Kaiserbacteria bacterium]|nr:TraR/DksA C4-type zinc finger protein [Candidatus Kaiserbacteria bacterium]
MQNIAGLKKRLEEERALLERELSALGVRNPSNPSDWVAAKPVGDEFGADRNDNADIIEEMEDNNAAMNELEGRINLVIRALEKMETGAYGVCEVCGEEIEADRLSANPAAPTCKVHMQ